MDPEGSWNGSVFTLIVPDTEPHFLYSISTVGWYFTNCSRLLDYHSSFTIPNGSDIIFVLNPVYFFLIPHLPKSAQNTLDGYKHIVSLSQGVSETYQYDVHGGELYIGIGEPQCPVTLAATATATSCPTAKTVTVTSTAASMFRSHGHAD